MYSWFASIRHVARQAAAPVAALAAIILLAPAAIGQAGNTGRWNGNIYSQFGMIDAVSARCQATCERESRCVAWTMVRFGAEGTDTPARCLLFDSVSGSREPGCCVSGGKGGAAPPAAPSTPAYPQSGPSVEVLAVVGDVEISPGGDDSQAYPLRPGMVVRQSDRIVTMMDSSATIRFKDGHVATVGELTDMKVAAYSDVGNLVHTRLWLRGGQLVSWLNRESERPSDFAVKTPTATIGTRGTAFVVRHDPVSNATIVEVTEGEVEVTPENPSLPSYRVRAGGRVVITAVDAKASGAAAASRPAGTPPPSSGGSSTRTASGVALSLQWAGRTGDVVAQAGRARADGVTDGQFVLDINTAAGADVQKVELFSVDAAGNPCCGQVWSTAPTGAWLLGVSSPGGRLFNPEPIDGLTALPPGRISMQLHANDSGWFRDGQAYMVVVTLTDGREARAMATIGVASPAAPSAGGGYAATPTSPPGSPPGSAAAATPASVIGVWRADDGVELSIAMEGANLAWRAPSSGTMGGVYLFGDKVAFTLLGSTSTREGRLVGDRILFPNGSSLVRVGGGVPAGAGAPPLPPAGCSPASNIWYDRHSSGWSGVWRRIQGNLFSTEYQNGAARDSGQVAIDFLPGGEVRLTRSGGFNAVLMGRLGPDGKVTGSYPSGATFELTCPAG